MCVTVNRLKTTMSTYRDVSWGRSLGRGGGGVYLCAFIILDYVLVRLISICSEQSEVEHSAIWKINIYRIFLIKPSFKDLLYLA